MNVFIELILNTSSGGYVLRVKKNLRFLRMFVTSFLSPSYLHLFYFYFSETTECLNWSEGSPSVILHKILIKNTFQTRL